MISALLIILNVGFVGGCQQFISVYFITQERNALGSLELSVVRFWSDS
jgi:hypothetical protein